MNLRLASCVCVCEVSFIHRTNMHTYVYTCGYMYVRTCVHLYTLRRRERESTLVVRGKKEGGELTHTAAFIAKVPFTFVHSPARRRRLCSGSVERDLMGAGESGGRNICAYIQRGKGIHTECVSKRGGGGERRMGAFASLSLKRPLNPRKNGKKTESIRKTLQG